MEEKITHRETISTLHTRLSQLRQSGQYSAAAQSAYDAYCQVLNTAADAYYSGTDSGITDDEYDQSIALLNSLEEAGLVRVNSESPTQKVNGGTDADSVQHKIPMLSLGDVFNHEELINWYRGQMGNAWSVEPKIDGLSVELWYNRGRLIKAATRGNGIKGEDVTATASRIKGIPTLIPFGRGLVVRGEVFMSHEMFAHYKSLEDPNAKNARNTAVGLFKRKDGGNAAETYLSCFVFNIQYIEEPDVEDGSVLCSHDSSLAFLEELGFSVVPHKMCYDLPQILAAVDKLSEDRDALLCRIDGAVVKVDNFVLRDRLGDNGVIPRWAIAYKYPAVEGSTIVESITYQVGKTGKLTPVANLRPVHIDGSTISRCTLHNRANMQRLNIQVGDRVFLHKSGDIIPKITDAERTPASMGFTYPTECPVCGESLHGGEKCINANCRSKIENKLYLWVDKGGLDIKGVSGSLVSQLIERGMLQTPADYYKLTPADLYKLPRMGASKVKNILTSIAQSKQRTFPEVITALGIESVGWSTACKITRVMRTWDAFASMTESTCIAYIGQSAGKKLYDALQTDYMKELIPELAKIFPFNAV